MKVRTQAHTLRIHEYYQAHVLVIKGKFLGSLHGEAFTRTIHDLTEAGKTRVVIDLHETDMMDSAAIGCLIAAAATLRRAGGDIRLANLKQRLRNLFLMTRLLGPVFKNYGTRRAALDSFADDLVAQPASS